MFVRTFPRLILALIFVLVLFGSAVPVFAQDVDPQQPAGEVVTDPSPTGDVDSIFDWQAVWDWVKLVGTFLALLVMISYGTGITAEGVKDLLRHLTANSLLKSIFPTGIKSAVLAFLVAYAAAKGFDNTLFKDIPLIASIDPQLITVMASIMIWAMASFFKRQGTLDYVYEAKPAADFKLDTIPPLFNLKKPK
jgi:magnesium-transporting ATPase (P-type)